MVIPWFEENNEFDKKKSHLDVTVFRELAGSDVMSSGIVTNVPNKYNLLGEN